VHFFVFSFFLSRENIFSFVSRQILYKGVRIGANTAHNTVSRTGESFQRETERESARVCVCEREKIR